MAKNHALVDGNKRLAWLSAVVFCDLNGMRADLSEDDAYDLVKDVAKGLADVQDSAARLKLVPVVPEQRPGGIVQPG